MLRFLVFDDDGPARGWDLAHAHLVGPDDMAAKGSIEFRKGRIVCRKRVGAAVGLCLPFDVGDHGRVLLPTCLLPDREEPYNLAVELARHRIKLFIAKSEEWQMFDLGPEHLAMQRWEGARAAFTEALTAEDPHRAYRLAQRSLVLGVQASERLAMAHADLLLHRRYAQRAAPSSTLGVRLRPGIEGRGLREIVERDFDVLVVPLSWRDLEVEEGRYEWGALDRRMEWAQSQGKPIVVGPLLDFSKRALPQWMYVWQHDYDTCRDLAYDHLERIVRRYAGAVPFWNIASGLNTNENFAFKPEQMIDLTRMAALLVRHTRRGARVMVELRQPFGEAVPARKDAVSPFVYIDRLVQEGVRLDAIGVQLLFGRGTPGLYTRDLMQISSLIDRFFFLETPIVVSALGVPSAPAEPDGGRWRGPWSDQVQQRWLSLMFAITLSKPFVESVFWSELVDQTDGELPGAGLIDAEGQPKPSLRRLINLRKHLRKPLGQLRQGQAAAENEGAEGGGDG